MVFTKTRRFILLFAGCLLLLLATGWQVFAGGKDDELLSTASICLCLRDPVDESAVNAACFSLYHVAAPAGAGGEEPFVYTPAFAACGIELRLEQAELLAGRLAAYAGQERLATADQQTSQAGRLCFSALAEGLYLLVQEGSVAGYYAASPFLVALPLLEADGSLNYEPLAFPKIERMAVPEPPVSGETEPEPTLPEVSDPVTEPELSEPPAREPVEPGKTDPADPDESRLIQTGQVNWPLPLLATAGFLLFSYGWPALWGKREEEDPAGGMTGRPVAEEFAARAADSVKTAEAEDVTDESQA